MVDPGQGGSMGAMPSYTTYNASAAYVKRHLIPIVIDAPRGFGDLDNPDQWRASLKSILELHAKSIEGLRSTLSAEYVGKAVGGAGEQQYDPSNVTREQSTPTFTLPELYGKPINNFLEGWITNLIMDPNTKLPAVVSRGKSSPSDLLPDYTGATVMFIEPDPTGRFVQNAWLCTNMMPKTGGENEGRRDLTSAMEGVDYSVEFTALTQTGYGVNKLAQKLLDEINYTGGNPATMPAFVDGISADIKAADHGYREQLSEAAKTYVS